jgi:uncharacterized protein YbbC (DUF1343 family)
MQPVKTGLLRFLADPPPAVMKKRLGLLCNPASTDPDFRHARFRIAERFPGRLTALFSPQHGFLAEKQDNMVESDHTIDPHLNIPVYSLYGEVRRPTAGMLADIDVLIVDLPDVGTRVYTFAHTLSLCMEAAREVGTEIVVLDRPNPVGGRIVEGNCLKPAFTSFVGRHPIPMRHGLTMGELARLINEEFGAGCRLIVVPMTGWKRWMTFRETGCRWVPPSPNLPTPESAAVYPGQVIFEGTNLSEGRGTTLPFEWVGAPYVDPAAVVAKMGGDRFPGVVLREIGFEPTAHKWAGLLCRGFQLHVTDAARYRSFDTALRLLGAIVQVHRETFEWKPPPYEYEWERRPIDLILGDDSVRRRLEAEESVDSILASFEEEIAAFRSLAADYLLY